MDKNGMGAAVSAQRSLDARRAKWKASGKCHECGKDRDSTAKLCERCRGNKCTMTARSRFKIGRKTRMGACPVCAVKRCVLKGEDEWLCLECGARQPV